ncbi:MAG TPA: cation-translocating P-type ATPase, partial [Methanomicrobiales archaeon]|nr:cation-translocating P-type ATPase [Methanomicrobiales archaeon]
VTTIDQAPITGESLPVTKGLGDAVFAGTRNLEGYIEVRVTRPGSESTIARVLALVSEAQTRRSRTEAFIERFSRIYTPAVLLLAGLLMVLPPLLFGVPLLEAIYRALILLVISCPCALAISTPVSMVSGITTAAHNGLLIKGRDYLESMSRARVIVFDKTGTLTTGVLEVTDVVSLEEGAEFRVLQIAASLESRSGHPVAEAILRRARKSEVVLQNVTDFESITGRGVRGSIDGTEYLLGNRALLDGGSGQAWEPIFRDLEAEGKSVVLVGKNSTVLGLIALSDTIRDLAAATVANLRSRGIHTVMLTGDSRRVGEAVCNRLGISECHAELLPEDKVASVERLIERYGQVVMVGDGVNDAPALARASVGVAMGAIGSDVAIETADIVILKDEISRVDYLVELSEKTMRVIRQNTAVSILVKFSIAALAIFGLVTLWEAVAFGDMGLSLAVIANALRIAQKVA